MYKSLTKDYITNLSNILKKTSDDYKNIDEVVDLIVNSMNSSKRIAVCGNGGSASTASHFVTDLAKIFPLKTGKKINISCLSDNIGLFSALANDIDYESVFSFQVQATLNKNDLLILISGSGNSPNVLKAAEVANQMGIITIGLLGYDGGKLASLCKHLIHIKSFDMQICEDIHLSIGHCIVKKILELND